MVALTEEEQARLDFLKQRQKELSQQRRQELSKPEDLEAAKKATGLDEYGTLARTGLGITKSFMDLGASIKQLATSDPKAYAASQKAVTEENELFSKYAGTAGTVGQVIGDVGMTALPGLGLASKIPVGLAATTGGRLALGTAGGAGAGFLQPVGTNETRAGNTVLGAGLGLVGGAAIETAGKGIKSLWNLKTGNTKAKRVAQKFLQEELADLEPAQVDRVNSLLEKYMKQPGQIKGSYTPGQLFAGVGAKSSIERQSGLLTDKAASSKFQDLTADQLQTELGSIKELSKVLNSRNPNIDLPVSQIVELGDAALTRRLNETKAIYFSKLNDTPASRAAIQALYSSEDNLKTMKKIINNPTTPQDLKDEAAAALQYLNTPGSPPPSARIINEIAYYGKGLNPSQKKLQQITQRGNVYQEAHTGFAQAQKAYDTVLSSKAYSAFKGSNGDIMSSSPRQLEKIANLLKTDMPEIADDLVAKHLNDIITSVGTSKQAKNIDELLVKLKSLHPSDEVKGVIDVIGDTLSRMKVTPKKYPNGAKNKEAFLSIGMYGLQAVTIRLNPFALFNSLKSSRYQVGLAKLLTDKEQWMPYLKQIIANKDKDMRANQLQALLDMVVGSTFSGTQDF